MIKVGCGDEGGGKTLEKSGAEVEGFTLMLTFEFLLDKFSRILQDLSSSILDLEKGTSGGIIDADSGIVVEVVSLLMMFVSTLDVCTVTSKFLVFLIFYSTEASSCNETLCI